MLHFNQNRGKLPKDKKTVGKTKFCFIQKPK